MSGKTRIEICGRSIGFYAQTLPDIITLSFLHPIRKTQKLSIHLPKAVSSASFSYRQKQK